jgi:hypothetical protein
MIIVFTCKSENPQELARFESSLIPEVNQEVKLPQGNFVVQKSVIEFFGSNDRHLVQLFVAKVK